MPCALAKSARKGGALELFARVRVSLQFEDFCRYAGIALVILLAASGLRWICETWSLCMKP